MRILPRHGPFVKTLSIPLWSIWPREAEAEVRLLCMVLGRCPVSIVLGSNGPLRGTRSERYLLANTGMSRNQRLGPDVARIRKNRLLASPAVEIRKAHALRGSLPVVSRLGSNLAVITKPTARLVAPMRPRRAIVARPTSPGGHR